MPRVMMTRGLGTSLALTLALVTSAGASRAAAQELADRSARVAGNLALGFAGELDAHVDDNRTDVDLDASVGFDARVEVPVADFLVIGGWFEFLSIETDAMGSEREESFGIDAFVRVRWVFEVIASTLFIEPYVLFPLGFSMAVLPDDDGTGDDVWPGWNTAVLGGAQVLHASGFGGYIEMGWRHAEAYQERTVPILGTSVDLALVLNELALNVGFVYAFGG